MIKELIEKWTCKHDWKELYKVDEYWSSNSKLPYETRITLVCKKCGKIKKIYV